MNIFSSVLQRCGLIILLVGIGGLFAGVRGADAVTAVA